MNEDELIKEIIKHKGLGLWTASVLAISHFGKEDVFPVNDGNLKKAVKSVNSKYNKGFDTEKATPYKSYLAFYLWGAMSQNIL